MCQRQARTSLGVKFSHHGSWEVCCLLFARPSIGWVTALPQQQRLWLRETLQLLSWFLSQKKGFSPHSQLLQHAKSKEAHPVLPKSKRSVQPEPGLPDNGSQRSLFSLLKISVNVTWTEVSPEGGAGCSALPVPHKYSVTAKVPSPFYQFPSKCCLDWKCITYWSGLRRDEE